MGVRFLEGPNENLLLDKALKSGVIFQKYALKLIKLLRKFEKYANFSENFRAGDNFLIMGQVRNIIWAGYNGGSGGGDGVHEGRKFLQEICRNR